MAHTEKENLPAPAGGDLILYQTEDGQTRLQVRLEGETVWLSLNQMADLFQRDKSVISKHIKNVFEEREFAPDSTVAKFATVQSEGGREVSREIEFYNLDVIISVGYRVKSHRGTQFRIWATQRLREYIIKGFTMDDERLKQAGGGNYFDELLARIRDIRSSEKAFWRKVLEIYATAEIIHARADAAKPNMGLTSWTGSRPHKADVAVAKNYLTLEEIEALNLIVSMYLDFAELQARSRKPMYMRDWIAKLDDFLRVSERSILSHAGRVTHEAALSHAEAEFEKWRQITLSEPSPVEKHFQDAIEKVKQLKAGQASKRKKKA